MSPGSRSTSPTQATASILWTARCSTSLRAACKLLLLTLYVILFFYLHARIWLKVQPHDHQVRGQQQQAVVRRGVARERQRDRVVGAKRPVRHDVRAAADVADRGLVVAPAGQSGRGGRQNG